MLNNKITDYKTINNVVAIFSGLISITLVLAPNTVANVFNVTYLSQAEGSWINSTRVVAIVCFSLALLASWARYIDEVYAQKVIMRFYSIMFLGFALSNFLGGIEGSVPVHSVSVAFIAVLFVTSWMCWSNSRGIEPNTKSINTESTVSLINNTQEDQDVKEAK